MSARAHHTQRLSDFIRDVVKKSPHQLLNCVFLCINKLGPVDTPLALPNLAVCLPGLPPPEYGGAATWGARLATGVRVGRVCSRPDAASLRPPFVAACRQLI